MRPMASRSLCLPPARTHFCTSAARGGSNGTGSSPRKYGTNCIIPELVNIGAVGWVRDQAGRGHQRVLACREEVVPGAAQLRRRPWADRAYRRACDRRLVAAPVASRQRLRDLGAELGLALAASPRGPRPTAARRSLPRPCIGAGEVGRHAARARSAGSRLAARSCITQNDDAEAEPGADDQPEQPLGTSASTARSGCGGGAGRPCRCPMARATALMTGLEKAR